MIKIIVSILLISTMSYVEPLFAQEVSRFEQCQQYVVIVVREKDRSELELANYMAKVEILEKENKALEKTLSKETK